MAVALAGIALLRPGSAGGQGAPIPLLPPNIATSPAPPTPEKTLPPAPGGAIPVTPYPAAPLAPFPPAPAEPSAEETAPIIATPLPAPAVPAANATPGAAAATAAPPSPEPPQQAAQTPPAAPPTALPLAPPQYPNVWQPQTTARLVVLNKIDAQRRDLTVKVGQSASYGALTITVRSCLVRPPDQPADATAFLVIRDSHQDEPGFSGWTLANEPWLSMLQNPVYDVWVAGCQP